MCYLYFRTALAESELEYNINHVSSSIYLTLTLQTPLPECLAGCSKDAPVYLVVWTTTPWTIPANQAVCYNPDKKYCLVRYKSTGCDVKYLVIALELCSSLEQLWTCQFTVIKEFNGKLSLFSQILILLFFSYFNCLFCFFRKCAIRPFLRTSYSKK